MTAIERIINGTVVDVAPTTNTINQTPARSKLLFDIRTDATLDTQISLTFSANPVPDFGAVGGLNSPTYTGTILVADMNKVLEFVFDTPISFISFTYSSSAGSKLYLAQFDWYLGSITRLNRE